MFFLCAKTRSMIEIHTSSRSPDENDQVRVARTTNTLKAPIPQPSIKAHVESEPGVPHITQREIRRAVPPVLPIPPVQFDCPRGAVAITHALRFIAAVLLIRVGHNFNQNG